MSKDSKSLNKIVTSGQDLILGFGIRKLTVEEICAKAEVSKMTFYRYFQNKKDLIIQVLKGFFDSYHQEYNKIRNQDISFPRKVEKLIQLEYKSGAKLSEAFIKEVYQSKEPILAEIIEANHKLAIKNLIVDFNVAQKEGWIRKDLKIEVILYLLNDINQKILDKNFRQLFGSTQECILTLSNFFFHGIMVNKNAEE